jgi:tryptophan synthase alpha chain
MARIAETFAKLRRRGRGGFIPFITAGDPDLATTESLLIELAGAGADIIELGIPFSDPIADGEVIQRASERALRNGVTLTDVFNCISLARARICTPIVLFSYFNPLLQFGEVRCAAEARRVGVDGVLVTDLIPEEAQSWSARLQEQHVDPIFLVAPTTSDARLTAIAQQARGFIYAISRTGVTGERDQLASAAEPLVRRIRAVSDLPIAIGFGVSTREQVQQVWRLADAAVIGSAIVREIEKCAGAEDLVPRIGALARSLVA